VGDFRVSPVYTVTANQSYCQPFIGTTLEINSIECQCAKTAAGRAIMDATADGKPIEDLSHKIFITKNSQYFMNIDIRIRCTSPTNI
jgi:hypothetical protein